MSGYWVDTEGVARVARLWARWGDDVAAARIRVASVTAALASSGGVAWVDRCLALASAELWTASTWLRQLAERVLTADTSDTPATLALRTSPGACPAPPPVSSLHGDLTGTFGVEQRSPYDVSVDVDDAAVIGRRLVVRALEDTASATQIRADEFELVELSDGRYLVVLPGVTDLSHPDLGYSNDHRSVRDLDREAFTSLQTAAVAGNGYARMVWDALIAFGVPAGSELVLVGHSFGADTALDLAADAGFNGPAGYRVSHVVAAGYDSVPQLTHVPTATRVLVLQNRDDAVVIAEQIGRAHVADAVESHADAIADAAHLDLAGFGRSTASALAHDAGAAAAGVSHLVARRSDIAGGLAALVTGDLDDALGHAHAVVTAEPGTRIHTESHVSVVFDGDAGDAGHHQRHYVEYLASATDPAVIAFLASLGASHVTSGRAMAVDVSTPRSAARPGGASSSTEKT